jgi:hypothetical protein
MDKAKVPLDENLIAGLGIFEAWFYSVDPLSVSHHSVEPDPASQSEFYGHLRRYQIFSLRSVLLNPDCGS